VRLFGKKAGNELHFAPINMQMGLSGSIARPILKNEFSLSAKFVVQI